MTNFRPFFGLLLLLLLGFSCQPSPKSTHTGPLLPADSVVLVLDQLREVYHLPALSVAVVQDGRTHYFQSGWADPQDSVVLDASHRMPLGSIGKTLVAARVLQLVENDNLALDTPVQQHLEQASWYQALPHADSITIRQLLNHSSGLPEYVYADTLWGGLKANPDKSWTVAERMELLAGAEAHFSPGQGWSYADANYILLGAILEKVDGQDLYTQLNTAFIEPLGLQQTTPAVGREQAGLVVGHTGGFLADVYGEQVSDLGSYHINPQFEWAGGGWISSAADLAHWVDALYEGDILREESRILMQDPIRKYPRQPANLGYGLGLDLFATRYGTAYGHTGFMPGFQSFAAYFPELDLSLAFQLSADPYYAEWPRGKSVFTLADELLNQLLSEKPRASGPATTLYFVRHAEKEADGTPDPALTDVGQARANKLRDLLQEEGITAIYSTPYRRTEQTAAPLAEALDLEILPYSPTNLNAIFEIIAGHAGGQILLVGHSNTTPTFINYLLGEKALEPLDESEYDKLFKLVYQGGQATLTTQVFNPE